MLILDRDTSRAVGAAIVEAVEAAVAKVVADDVPEIAALVSDDNGPANIPKRDVGLSVEITAKAVSDAVATAATKAVAEAVVKFIVDAADKGRLPDMTAKTARQLT